MIGALSKSISQVGDPAFRGVLKRAVGVTFLVLVLVWVGAWFALDFAGIWFDDWLAAQGTDGTWTKVWSWLFDAALFGGILIGSLLLFPAVVTLAMSLFLDEIAEAVERRHYPGLPTARSQPVREIIGDGLALVLITIVLNLLVLPLYLIPVVNLFVFYGINGYLLGREYFEMVAVRRMDSREAKQLRRQHRGRVFLAGAIIAFLLTIPIVNLVAPILATAFLVHIFETLRQGAARGGAA